MNADPGADAPLHSTASNGSGRSLVILVAWLAMAVPLAIIFGVLALLLPWVPWWTGLLVGLVIGAVMVLVQLRGASGQLLKALGAVPADPADHARFFNLAQGLSLAGGISDPELYLVIDEARNAAAVAQGDRSAIVVTTGLHDAIDRMALEGIVAEALVRIENGDAEASTIGAALFGPLLVGPWSAVVRPLAGFGLNRLLGSDRDLAADRAAVALTRYPPGLLAGLDLIRGGTPAVSRSSRATDHVWLVPPSAVDRQAGVVLPSASLDLRIDVLAEL